MTDFSAYQLEVMRFAKRTDRDRDRYDAILGMAMASGQVLELYVEHNMSLSSVMAPEFLARVGEAW